MLNYCSTHGIVKVKVSHSFQVLIVNNSPYPNDTRQLLHDSVQVQYKKGHPTQMTIGNFKETNIETHTFYLCIYCLT